VVFASYDQRQFIIGAEDYIAQDVNAEKARAAGQEEIVVHADLFKPQDLFSGFRYLYLVFRDWQPPSPGVMPTGLAQTLE